MFSIGAEVMSFNKMFIVFSFLALPLSGMADSGENSPLYIGINGAKYELTATTASGTESSVEYDGYMFNLGYDFNNYLSLEADAGLSSSENEATPGSSSKIDYTVGLYLKLNMRFDRVVVSLLGGQTSTKMSVTTGATTTSDTESSTAGGIGIDFFGTRDLALTFRRMIIYTKDNVGGGDTTITATTAGITYYFDTPRIRSRY